MIRFASRPTLFSLGMLLVLLFFTNLPPHLLAQPTSPATETETPTILMTHFLADQQPTESLAPLGLTPCVGGQAAGYPCDNVDLLAFLPLASIGGGAGSANWGWTDPGSGREFALMGRSNGTAFVEITNPTAPVYLGNLPSHTGTSSWRELKSYSHYAFIVSDLNGAHGMQIFDLNQLLNVVNPPVTFSETVHYNNINSGHTITVNEATGYAYISGSNTCSGGLHMVNIQNPLAPSFAGCFSSDGYSHDVQCVIYHGPDSAHQGKEICLAYNEDTVTIVDVTNKAAPVQLSRTGYTGSDYVHQGWLTEDHAYMVEDDELDEQSFGHNTRSYIWDVRNLDQPVLMGYYQATTPAIDHNQFFLGDFLFQANYRAGMRILAGHNISNGQLNEVGYFDIYPANDNPNFNGAWHVYPYFPSGVVIVSGIEQGLFVLQPTLSPDYHLQPATTELETCQMDSDSTQLDLTAVWGYSGTVALSAQGLPPGAAATFNPPSVIVPGNSQLTVNVSNTTAGSYPFTVTATDTAITHTADLNLNVFNTSPGIPTLVTPANGASAVSRKPTFNWTAAAEAQTYTLEIDDNPTFNSILFSTTTSQTSYPLTTGLDPLTTYYWRVRASNGCGLGADSATFSFTTLAVPSLLLVDDDDNSPDSRAIYTAALDTLGQDYDIWDTAISTNEPVLSDLAPYSTIIWFSGDAFSSSSPRSGPTANSETALSTWLNAGNCFFLSAEDYLYDRGITSFMTNYLGLQTGSSDTGDYASVHGQGTVFGNLPSMPLSYAPVSDFADHLTANGTAEIALQGNNNNTGAINKENGVYKTTFWGFPWEALANNSDELATLSTFLHWCGNSFNVTSDSSAAAAPGTTLVHTFVLENLNNTDTYTLTLSAGNWNTTLLTPSPVTVSGNTTATLHVQVHIPTIVTPPSETDTFFLTVQSGNNPNEVEIVNGTTESSPYAAALTPTSLISATAGATITHTFTLNNNSAWPDSFTLAVTGHSWSTTIINNNPVTLNSGDSTTIALAVTIPMGNQDSGDTFILTVTSLNAPNLILTATGTTQIITFHDLYLPILYQLD